VLEIGEKGQRQNLALKVGWLRKIVDALDCRN